MTEPVTAIVIFRNEKSLLEGCLNALDWCDELILVDMESSDGSCEIAKNFADRLFWVKTYPIAEPTRIAAAKLAKHDWILLVDPDEHIPPALNHQIQEALKQHAHAGAIRLPWWYYFKRKRLDGTIWGGGRAYKRMIINRNRCMLLPYCNRITELMTGQYEFTIEHDGDNHIRHYWSDSYLELTRRHLTRYCHLEAAAQYANGTRFNLFKAITHPVAELKRCLKDFDGWRMGPRGFILSSIYFTYIVLSDWLLLYCQLRGKKVQQLSTTQIPRLIEQPLDTGPLRRRKAA